MLTFSTFDIFFRWFDWIFSGYLITNYLVSEVVLLVLIIFLIFLLFKKRSKNQPEVSQKQGIYPEQTVQIQTPLEPRKKSGLSFLLYLIWGLISVSPVVIVLHMFFCINSSCGGTASPGITLIIAIVMLGFWLLITVDFLLFCKKILGLPGLSFLMVSIWLIIFIGGYFLSGYQTKGSEQKAQQSLEDFKKNEITEINSPYVKVSADSIEYNDGQINFKLPSNFITINGRAVVPIRGEQKVIGFTDKSYKIRIVWRNNLKCSSGEKTYCETPLKPSIKETSNSNGVILRFYELSKTSSSIPLDEYFVSLDKSKFDLNNFLSISYDGNYIQGQYNQPSEFFKSAYNSLIQNINIQ